VEVVASLSQSRTAAAQSGMFTHKSVPVIFEPPCSSDPAALFGRDKELRMIRKGSFVIHLTYFYLYISLELLRKTTLNLNTGPYFCTVVKKPRPPGR